MKNIVKYISENATKATRVSNITEAEEVDVKTLYKQAQKEIKQLGNLMGSDLKVDVLFSGIRGLIAECELTTSQYPLFDMEDLKKLSKLKTIRKIGFVESKYIHVYLKHEVNESINENIVRDLNTLNLSMLSDGRIAFTKRTKIVKVLDSSLINKLSEKHDEGWDMVRQLEDGTSKYHSYLKWDDGVSMPDWVYSDKKIYKKAIESLFDKK